MQLFTIYVVDDEESIRDGAQLALGKMYHIKTFSKAEDALDLIHECPPDLVLLDISLPGINGIEALKRIKSIRSDICVIMITAFEDISTVISAMRLGAYDFVTKPFQMKALKLNIQNALNTIRLQKEVQSLQQQYIDENFPCLIGVSRPFQNMMSHVESIAQSPDTPVLILGETGTGKELIAKAIHCKSPNYSGSFVTLNCAAIPKDLVESELFGYEKGAFSGASLTGKTGLVEQAAGGTLFLDEVGDLSLEAQAKLLRFLEEGEYFRIGGSKKRSIRTRVVSATNKDLDNMIDRNLFRADLFHRLAVLKVEIPPLNQRAEDIVPIAHYFLRKFSMKFKKKYTRIAPESEAAMKKYHWKGNIRELRNFIEREVLIGIGPELKFTLNNGRLGRGENGGVTDGVKTFPNIPFFSSEGLDLTGIMTSLESYYIREALRVAEGNASKAARYLNMSYYSFRRHREKLNL